MKARFPVASRLPFSVSAASMAMVFAASHLHAATDYTNSSADSWATGTNWSGGTAPSGAFNQRINIRGGTAVTFSAAQGTVTTGGSLAADARALAVANTAGTGTLNITGGILQANASASGVSLVGTNLNGSNGALNISGGLLDLTTATNNGRVLSIGLSPSVNTVTGIVTLSGTGTLKVSDFRFNESDTAPTSGSITGTLNLNGGTLETGGIREGSSGTAQTNTFSTVNLNGGLLKLTAATGISASLNTVNVQSGGARIEVVTAVSSSSGKALLDGGGGGGLTKSGSGTLTLASGNTYTGETIIKSGTLKINSSTAIGTSSKITVGDTGSSGTVLDVTGAGINVGSSQTVSGIGTVLATGQTVAVDGTLAPGNSPGTLTIDGGTLALGNAAILNFELNPSSNTVGAGINDLVSVLGNLTFDGILNVTPTSGDFLSASLGTAWRLFNYTGTFTDNTVTFGSMPSLGAGLNWSIDTATSGQVNLIVVPEPHAALLGGLSLLAVLRRRRQGGIIFRS